MADRQIGASAAGAASASWVRPLIETAFAAVVVALILTALACAEQSYETNWIVIAVLPIAFWLFFSGRISTFKAFGVELTAVIRQASGETIKEQDFALFGSQELTLVEVGPKGDISGINRCIERKLPAISCNLKKLGFYTAGAIKAYIERLTQYGFFKWVVFLQDDRFAGLVPARNLKMANLTEYDRLKKKIEKGDVSDLPGFVGPELALRTTETKGQAIDRFAETDHSDLPVLDAQSRFIGVLNRGRLQSRFLSSILSATRAGS